MGSFPPSFQSTFPRMGKSKKRKHSKDNSDVKQQGYGDKKKEDEVLSSPSNLTSSIFGSDSSAAQQSQSLTSCLFGSTSGSAAASNVVQSSLFSNSETFQEISRKQHQQRRGQQQQEQRKINQTKVPDKQTILSRRRKLTKSTRKQVESIAVDVTSYYQEGKGDSAISDSSSSANSDDEEEDKRDVDEEEVNQGVTRLLVGRCSSIFRKQGVLILKSMINHDQDESLMKSLQSRAAKVEKKVCRRLDAKLGEESYLPQSLSSEQKNGKDDSSFRFQEVASRCLGRLDIRYGMDRPPFSNLHPDPCRQHQQAGTKNSFSNVLWPLVQDLLGQDAQLVYMGLIASFPNSQDQPWHQDGASLFPDGELMDKLPPYALNVFVPLLDITEDLGPTEFWLASHCTDEARRSFLQELSASPSSANTLENKNIVGPLLKVGDALIYDYRICHRGTSNLSDKTRPMLYLMYARPWFKEHLNFGSEQLFSDTTNK